MSARSLLVRTQRKLVGATLVFILISGLLPANLAAQIRPMRPVGGVSVTPDGKWETVTPGWHDFSFTVTNDYNYSVWYDLTPSRTGDVLSCESEITTLSLGAYESMNVPVTCQVASSGTGTARLTASSETDGSDSGYYNVEVGNNEGAPTVTLKNHNGDNRDQTLCLTSGAGEAAAWRCGHLLITHSLPSYATMGRERSLTLVYNSAQAVPKPVVVAWVDQSNVDPPDSVIVELWVNGFLEATGTYPGWGTGALVRQVALTYNAAGRGSGAYPFTLSVKNQYGGSVCQECEANISDTLLVVDRSQSEFGRGWWLAGVEQLVTNQPNNSILWLGGDGSAKLFRNVGTYTWVAPAGAFRDTLTLAGGIYTRTLRHGIQVKYNSAGQHIQTVNRVGQTSTFTWSTSPSRLISIEVPPGGTGTVYNLAYDGNQKLDYITDPANRTLQVGVSGGKLTSITDPDGYGVAFTHDGTGRINQRTNRRGYTTKYYYSTASLVWKLEIPVSATNTSVTKFFAWNRKGLAFQDTATAVDTAQSYTKILGPRAVADDASFWVDRWGAPVKIVDPLGNTTNVVRGGNAAVPALVTEVIYPNDRRVKMTWDARGNLREMRDSTLHLSNGLPTSVTSWTYNDPNTQDSPDQVIDPEGVTTQFGYNSWGITDQVIHPNGHHTVFDYIETGSKKGLLQTVTEQSILVFDSAQNREVGGSPSTEFTYNSLGNLWKETSALGNVREFQRDAAQRVQHYFDAHRHRTEFQYDELNRRLKTIQYIEGDTALETRYTYDIDVLDSIIDPRGVLRRFEYNRAGWMTAEISRYDGQDYEKTLYYNEAGLVDSVHPRWTSLQSDMVRYAYDVAGRRTKVTWPRVIWPQDTVAADSVVNVYDELGRLLTATTGQRKIWREYYGNGWVKTEVQADPDSTDRQTHKYAYDLAGRQEWYRVGSDAENDSIWYHYDGTTGALTTVAVRWRNGAEDSVTFEWDELGRRDTLRYTNGMVVGFAYDADGRFRRLCSTHNGLASPDVFKIRLAHEWVDSAGLVRRLNALSDPQCTSNSTLHGNFNTYDARHQLVGQDGTTYAYDHSGNMTLKAPSSGTARIYEIMPGTNLLLKDISGDDSNDYISFDYLGNGSRYQEVPISNGDTASVSVRWRFWYYDGLGRVSGTREQDWGSGQFVGSANDCWYDPLGRLLTSCGDLSANVLLGYDGQNVVRTGRDGQDFSWTIVHGPGTDDPLMGYYGEAGVAECDELYWVTDGQGRQYAVGALDGADCSPGTALENAEAKYAGGTRSANSFDAERIPNAQMRSLSFFRNRFYDQETGRWTQEDPIGLAGGLNLFAYANNNPANFTDPFGLRVCFTVQNRDELKAATERAVGGKITLDQEGCVAEFEPHDISEGRKMHQYIFDELVQREDITIIIGLKDVGSTGWSGTNIGINKREVAERGYQVDEWKRSVSPTAMPIWNCAIPERFAVKAPYSVEAVIVHELIGHGQRYVLTGTGNQIDAIDAENTYHAALDEPGRCRWTW